MLEEFYIIDETYKTIHFRHHHRATLQNLQAPEEIHQQRLPFPRPHRDKSSQRLRQRLAQLILHINQRRRLRPRPLRRHDLPQQLRRHPEFYPLPLR